MHDWHPLDEATAASAMAVFVEWVRAAARQPQPPRWVTAGVAMTGKIDPEAAFRWQAEEPASFAAAIAAFAGLDQSLGVLGNRLRYTGPKEALVLRPGGARLAWSRDELRMLCGFGKSGAVPALPADIDTALREGTWEEVIAETAFHLLRNNTRPDDRVLCEWRGVSAADKPRPHLPSQGGREFGVLTVGATLILADAAANELAAIAAAEQARMLRPLLSGPGVP
jgi:hypothetical protein